MYQYQHDTPLIPSYFASFKDKAHQAEICQFLANSSLEIILSEEKKILFSNCETVLFLVFFIDETKEIGTKIMRLCD